MKASFVMVVAMVVGLAMWVAYRQQQANDEVRRALVQIQEQVQRLQKVRAGEPVAPTKGAVASTAITNPAGADNSELAKLRAEIAALKTSTQELTRVAQAAAATANPTASVPNNLVPSTTWKNVGKATPDKALETVLWAAVGGDVDTLSQGITFTPTARAKAEAWFGTLSEKTRQQYGSAEKIMALMIAKDAETLAGMQVLGQKEITADDTAVRVRVATEQGKTKDDNFVFHRATDGWRLILSDAVVEKFALKVGGGK